MGTRKHRNLCSLTSFSRFRFWSLWTSAEVKVKSDAESSTMDSPGDAARQRRSAVPFDVSALSSSDRSMNDMGEGTGDTQEDLPLREFRSRTGLLEWKNCWS